MKVAQVSNSMIRDPKHTTSYEPLRLKSAKTRLELLPFSFILKKKLTPHHTDARHTFLPIFDRSTPLHLPAYVSAGSHLFPRRAISTTPHIVLQHIRHLQSLCIEPC